MSNTKLPALPGAVQNVLLGDDWQDVYTADQMHAYARQALDDRERQAGEAVALSVDTLNDLWRSTIDSADPTAGNAHIHFARKVLASLPAPQALQAEEEGRYRLAPPEYQTPEYHASVLEAVRTGRVTYAPGWNEPPSPDGRAEQAEAPSDGDFVMLDDEGKAMMAKSHHYTVKDIRALIDDLKAVEQGTEQPEWINRDHRTRCGVIWRVMAALASDVPVAPLTEAERNALATQPTASNAGERWDEKCVLGHCGSPSGCERDMQCRAALASKPPAGEQKPAELPKGAWQFIPADTICDLIEKHRAYCSQNTETFKDKALHQLLRDVVDAAAEFAQTEQAAQDKKGGA